MDADTRPAPWLRTTASPVGALFSVTSLQQVDLILSIAFMLAIIAVIVLVALALRRELSSDTVLLDPIEVPDDFAARGYRPAVVAARLLDALREMQNRSGASSERRAAERAASAPEVQLPGARLSVRSFIRYLRRLLGKPPTEITGEITKEDGGYRIRLRQNGVRIVTVGDRRPPTHDLDLLFQSGAGDLLLAVDPYPLIATSYSGEMPGPAFPRTTALIERALANPKVRGRAWILGTRAMILDRQGNREEAEDVFQEALARPPLPNAVVNNYVLMLLNAGERDRALAEMDAMAERARRAHDWSAVAGGYTFLHVGDRALAAAESAIALDPKSPHAIRARGMALAVLHRYPAAIAELRRAVSMESSFLVARGQLASVLARSGNGEEALRIADAGLRENPAEVACLIGRSFALLALGHGDAAVSAFEHAGRMALGRAPVWWGRGRALLVSGRPAEALAEFERAVERDPYWSESWCGIGQALMALDRASEAVPKFEQAFEVDASDPDTLHAWADALYLLGRDVDASVKRRAAEALAARNDACE